MGKIIPDNYKTYYLKGHIGIWQIVAYIRLVVAGHGE